VNDAQLLLRLRDGDPTAFDAVYARYATRIHGFVLRLVRDRVAADDIAQETWVAFARAAVSLRENSDLGAYLFAIARNEARSHRRWALLDVGRLVTLDDDAGALEDAAAGPETRREGRAAAERLERALSQLPPHYREVLLLVGVEGFAQERAAEILSLSYAAARQRLTRARAALNEALAREERAHARGVIGGTT
jgi:RNA polymerase sigma factor (sigma-70 family)